jgi:hypothetical protein
MKELHNQGKYLALVESGKFFTRVHEPLAVKMEVDKSQLQHDIKGDRAEISPTQKRKLQKGGPCSLIGAHGDPYQ